MSTAVLKKVDSDLEPLVLDPEIKNIVGRGKKVTTKLYGMRKAKSLSRVHATIYYDRNTGKWILKDNNSKFGVMINDRRIASETEVPLMSGDVLEFGVSPSSNGKEKDSRILDLIYEFDIISAVLIPASPSKKRKSNEIGDVTYSHSSPKKPRKSTYEEEEHELKKKQVDEEISFFNFVKIHSTVHSTFLLISNLWTSGEKKRFQQGLAQYSSAVVRRMYCELVGLKPSWVKSCSRPLLEVACQNVNITSRNKNSSVEVVRNLLLKFIPIPEFDKYTVLCLDKHGAENNTKRQNDSFLPPEREVIVLD